jgi:cation diffusion facilitator CzcD-associated flavoprotein CzcO
VRDEIRARRRRRSAAPAPRVAIVGGGWGGIITAVKLKQRGITSFVIFEREDGPGGVWYANSFPGLGVDVPAHLYSFSFKRHYDWSRTHPLRDEILEYTNEIVDEWRLRPHYRFGTTVSRIVWDDDRHVYSVELGDGEAVEFDVVVSAVGVFHTPRYPEWPGLDVFEGSKFHTRDWDHDHDFGGDTVAIVGTGATAVQIVPELAARARKVYVFQREPGWVIPRNDREWTPEERAHLARPHVQRLKRIQMYVRFERLIFGMRRIREKKASVQVMAESYIDERFRDRPDLRAAVTPTYPFGGKRPLFDGSFYDALARDNVELVPSAVKEMTRDGVVTEDGVERRIDTLVMATGYRVSDYLAPLDVRGRGGRSLHEFWRGEPTAFLGITVPGFPNFYILYGPNTNGGGSISVQLERQGEFVARAVRRMRREGVTAIEVTPWAYLAWDAYVRWRNSKQVYSVSRSYYRAQSGKVLTEWPGTLTEYWLLTRLFGRLSSTTARRRARVVPSTDAVSTAKGRGDSGPG